MTTNTPTATRATRLMGEVLEVLKGVDVSEAEAKELVPLVKAIQAVAAFASVVDAEIQRRAVTLGVDVPGATLKDSVTQRKWIDAKMAADMAFAQFGVKAFKLDSPAGVEKLGPEGKAFAALASTKPAGSKKAVY